MAELSEKDQRLLAAIDAYSETAYGSDSTVELAQQRSGSIERYLGRNINPAPAGRSQVRDRTTYETVEWIKPSLLRIFCGSDAVVEFDPVGPEDEASSLQESDYVNYVVTQKNNWHALCNDWFHDALLCKNGYAHAYWDARKQTESEFYKDLTDDGFALLVQDKENTVVSHDQRPNDELNQQNQQRFQQMMQQWQMMAQQAAMQGQQPPPPPQQPPPAFFHDCEIKKVNIKGQAKICVIPPEHTLVDIDTPDWTLEGANYFEYFDYRTIGSLRADGYDVPDDVQDDAYSTSITDRQSGFEELSRDIYNESGNTRGDEFEDRSMRRVKIRYVWVRHDYNEDGIDELQYSVWVGQNILFRQECEEIPVSSITPIPLAHRHIGMSVADSVEDIEDVNTNITRGAIDNLNLSNTPRLAVSDRVNMSDLLDVRVGGVIRVDGQPPQEIMPVGIPDVFGSAVQAIQFFDSRRMNRTGINAYFQGTDSNTLNKTASGISQLTSSAAQRVEMIARLFSIGVKRLFLIVHRLILQHGHSKEVVRMRNKWITVDPAEWRKREDLKIVVGLGTGTKEGQIQQLGQLFTAQMQTLPLGVTTPPNVYHTLVEMAKATGFAGSERFFTDPTNNPPPQPPPHPQVQAEQIKQQASMQAKQMDIEQEQKLVQFRAQNDSAKAQQDLQIEQMKIQADQQTEIQKSSIEAQTQKEIEQMRLAAAEREALMKMATQLMVEQEKSRATIAAASMNGESQQSESQQNGQADHMAGMQEMMSRIAEMAQTLAAPKEVVRDQNGRVVGVRTIQ